MALVAPLNPQDDTWGPCKPTKIWAGVLFDTVAVMHCGRHHSQGPEADQLQIWSFAEDSGSRLAQCFCRNRSIRICSLCYIFKKTHSQGLGIHHLLRSRTQCISNSHAESLTGRLMHLA